MVWPRIRHAGTRHYPAYDLGPPWLSCVFCIFAPRNALLLAGKHNRELIDRCEVERTGFAFRQGLPLVEVRAALDRGEEPGPIKLTGDVNMRARHQIEIRSTCPVNGDADLDTRRRARADVDAEFLPCLRLPREGPAGWTCWPSMATTSWPGGWPSSRARGRRLPFKDTWARWSLRVA